MIVKLDWEVFKNRIGSDTIWVTEDETTWKFYNSPQPSIIIRSVVEKSLNVEDNIMFVERELTNRPNFAKCDEVCDKLEVPEEIFVEQKMEEEDDEEEAEGDDDGTAEVVAP